MLSFVFVYIVQLTVRVTLAATVRETMTVNVHLVLADLIAKHVNITINSV